MKSETVLIVEDHPLYSDALVSLVQGIPGTNGALSARSAEEGLVVADKMRDLRLILLDHGLPGLNGVEAIRTFRNKFPGVVVVVISATEERQAAIVALRAGAAAFLSKATSMEVTADLVRKAMRNELGAPQWITPAGKLLVSLESPVQLTMRQSEILALLMQGKTNKEICLTLGVAEVTVKMHMSSIFRSLGVINRTQAVIAARKIGLYQGADPSPAAGPASGSASESRS